MRQTFSITGMHCGSCVAKLTKALEPLADTVHVTLVPPAATLTSSQPVPLATLNAAVSAVGTYTLNVQHELPLAPAPAAPNNLAAWFKTYRPLLLIAGYLALVPLAAGGGLHGWMNGFMAGFFLVFSFFKMLDLKGFADAYAGYDLLARRWRPYGYIYPFIELGLGLAYLFELAPAATNAATLLVMAFSTLGVLKALLDKRQIRCACLGTVLNLPMTTVTLVEDSLMVAMAAFMLVTL